MDLSAFLRELAAFGGLLAFAAALATLLFSERLKSTLGRIVSKELQEQKAAIDKELERYRVGLLSDIERIKANQQVRTALALKVAEHKFAALVELNSAFSRTAAELVVIATDDEADSKTDEDIENMYKRVQRLEDAIQGANMYFEPEFREELNKLLIGLVDALPLCDPKSAQLPPDQGKELVDLSKRLEQEVRQRITAFLSTVDT